VNALKELDKTDVPVGTANAAALVINHPANARANRIFCTKSPLGNRLLKLTQPTGLSREKLPEGRGWSLKRTTFRPL
jgi:hypothetical protein